MPRPDEVVLPDFQIFETNEFLKQLKKLPPGDTAFLRKKLDTYVYPQIKEGPFWGKNIKKLHDYSPDMWRYRIGKFRLFYTIDSERRILSMVTVDDRKDAYK